MGECERSPETYGHSAKRASLRLMPEPESHQSIPTLHDRLFMIVLTGDLLFGVYRPRVTDVQCRVDPSF